MMTRSFATIRPPTRAATPVPQVVPRAQIQRTCAACATEDDVAGAPQAKAAPAGGIGHSFSRLRVHAERGAPPAVLTIGRPDDPAEHEADAIASAIVRGEAHSAPRRAPPSPTAIQAKGVDGEPCPDEVQPEDEQPAAVQAKAEGASGAAPASAAFASALSSRRTGGTAMPGELRSSFQARLGSPLGEVRLHTDPEAGRLARSIGAEAFTSGHHVYFAPGRYAPTTPAGMHLLAHELVHVAQQRGAGPLGSLGPVRRYTLSGFDPTQTAEMTRAIPVAKATVLGCTGKGVPQSDRINIVNGLDAANYVFAPEQEECGHSNPFTDTIRIGPAAFDTKRCCDLESTLAHECGHSFAWMIESSCRKLECKCFNCCAGA